MDSTFAESFSTFFFNMFYGESHIFTLSGHVLGRFNADRIKSLLFRTMFSYLNH